MEKKEITVHPLVNHPEDLKSTRNSIEIFEFAPLMIFGKIAEVLNNGIKSLILWNNDQIFAPSATHNNRPHVPQEDDRMAIHEFLRQIRTIQ